MKKRVENYGFWVSMISGIVMLIQALGFKINLPYVNEIITAVMGVLVVLGIVNNPTDGKGYGDSIDDDSAK